MKQLFQACLTWGESGDAVNPREMSAYTDEEHLSGNRKRLTQLRKRTSEMSGQFAAQSGVQIDCNPPSTAVAATSASYSAPAATALSIEDEEYIESLANIVRFPEVAQPVSDFSCDPLAAAAAKVASKITVAISTDMTLAVSPTSESARPEYIDPNVITAELPILNFQPPPKPENKSGLSGSFRSQNSGQHKMSHWKTKKAGTEAWDSRVESGLKAYEINSKYTSSQDDLPVLLEPADGCSFIEMDTAEDAPLIESYGNGHVRMITNYDNQGGGIRRLSSMRNSFKMLECRDDVKSAKPIEPSNSFDAFSSFVSHKPADTTALQESTEETYVDTSEALSIIEELLQETEPPIVDSLEETFGELLVECYEAAKTFEVSTEETGEQIKITAATISFVPDQVDYSILEDYAGNFSVTMADSLSMSELDKMSFDPKSFVAQTIDGEPIEAVCVFDSEKLSFNAPETIRTELESIFNMDPLSQVDESKESAVEIENVTVVTIEDCETLEIAAVGGKPSRQRTKGTSRSKKTQTRKEKKSKKRAAANA